MVMTFLCNLCSFESGLRDSIREHLIDHVKPQRDAEPMYVCEWWVPAEKLCHQGNAGSLVSLGPEWNKLEAGNRLCSCFNSCGSHFTFTKSSYELCVSKRFCLLRLVINSTLLVFKLFISASFKICSKVIYFS